MVAGLRPANILPCCRNRLISPTSRPVVISLLARVLAGVTLASFAIGLVFTFLAASIRPPGTGDPLGDLSFVLSFAMFPVIGYVLATRRPENSIGG